MDFTLDPFYALAREIEATKTKVADSVFEGYKLSVAQTNDINNRAMQVALNNTAALADLKQATAEGTLQTMLAASRTDAAIGQTAQGTQRLIMEQGEATRDLINGIDRENLNTALINTNTALIAGGIGYGQLGLAYGGLNGAYQQVSTSSAINALGSQISGQRFVNTGNSTGTVQTASPTQVG
jgi:hypothetical protein